MEIIKAKEKDISLIVDMKMKMFKEVGSITLLQDNAEEFIRNGYAAKIVEAILNWLEEKDVHNVKLKPSGAGRLMYEKMGFHDSGEMEKWI